MRGDIWTCLKLPSRCEIRFGDDVSIILRLDRSLSPGAPCHTPSYLREGRITKVYVATRSVEIQGAIIPTSSGPGSSLNCASDVMTGEIGCRRPAALVKV